MNVKSILEESEHKHYSQIYFFCITIHSSWDVILDLGSLNEGSIIFSLSHKILHKTSLASFCSFACNVQI